MMNKFINDPDNLTAELLEGYVMAYSNQVAIGGENIIVRAHAKAEDKVAVITLGGCAPFCTVRCRARRACGARADPAAGRRACRSANAVR